MRTPRYTRYVASVYGCPRLPGPDWAWERASRILLDATRSIGHSPQTRLPEPNPADSSLFLPIANQPERTVIRGRSSARRWDTAGQIGTVHRLELSLINVVGRSRIPNVI